jgi:hypothetical protein
MIESVSVGEQSLADLKDAEAALIEARQALVRAMSGFGGQAERERFIFKVGFARGRLEGISSRIHQAGEFAEERQ